MFGKFANNLTFIWCNCDFYDRCGVPCPHVFHLVDEMSINMVHVRHWKVYDAHYGDNRTDDPSTGDVILHSDLFDCSVEICDCEVTVIYVGTIEHVL